SLPACWSAAGNASAVYVASSGYVSFSSNGLYFTGSGGTQAIAILPEFETDLNILQIAFKHVEENTAKSGKVNLGYYKDEAFTSLKAYDITTSWKTEDAFVLTGIPAGAKLAFAYTPVNSAYTAGIDDITISVAPACAIPTELQASAIEATTATLSWTSEAENFKVQYTVNKENWGEEHAVNAKTFDLTELTPNTTYYARVKAVCGVSEESDYSSEIEFTTKCAVKTLPFAESFADGLPECWSAASQWAHYNYEPYAMRYTSSANGDLVLPEITLNDAAQLSFKHQSSYTSCSVILNDGENLT
ncbi:MAG: fibronectin type III domain-containing protein, partial [Paludibacteraceae bacterium]|nr:fibronectin type III domain-containing protein [Paludibacteraceae bacterium]